MAVTVASLMTKMGYDGSELVAGLSGSSGLLRGFMSGFTGILTTGVVVAGAALGAIGESFMKIQDALTPVMTLTGENTQLFRDMSQSIKDVISSSPQSADDIGMAAYKILSAGITDAVQANLALVASNQLALAGLGSVTQASDLITSAMNNWKGANLSANDAAQLFFGTVQVGKTTTADLAQGFGSIAPLADAAGISLQTLMSATAALTVTGMPAATAYTGLRNIISSILKPADKAKAAAAEMGLQFDITALKSKGLAGFLADVADKTGGDPAKIAELFRNIRGLNAVMALTGPQAQTMADDFDLIGVKGQNLAEISDEVSGTFSNRIKEMKNHVMVYLADLGQNGLDWMAKKWQDWGPGITDVANHLKDNLIAIFDAIKQHLQDFGSGWISSSKDSPSGFFENLGSIARGVYEDLLGFFRVLKSSFLDFITGWSDGGESGPSGFWQRVGSIAEQTGQGMLDLFANIKTAFGGFVTGWTSTGDDSPSGFWENLGSKAEGVKDDLIQWFANIQTAYQGFVDGFDSGTYDRPGSPAGFFENLGDKAADAKNIVTGVLDTLGTSYSDFVTGWESGTYDRPGSPTGFFENLGSKAKTADDIIKNALADIKKLNDMSGHEDDKGKKDSGVYKFSIVVNQVGLDIVNGLLTGVRTSMRLLNEEIIPAATLIWSGFSGILTQEIAPALALIGRLTADVVGPAFRGLKGIVTEEVAPALTLFGGSIKTGTMAPLLLVARIINEEVIPAFWLLVGTVTGAGNATINALAWLRSEIVSIFRGAGSWLYNAGRDLMNGLINGINSKIQDAVDAVSGAAGKIVRGMSFGLGNRSPSKLARQQGLFFMEGFRLGLQDMHGPVMDTVTKLTSRIGSLGGVKGVAMSSHSSTVNYGAPGSVVINMPNGSNGEDVVRALRNWSRANGRVPIAVTGRSA